MSPEQILDIDVPGSICHFWNRCPEWECAAPSSTRALLSHPLLQQYALLHMLIGLKLGSPKDNCKIFSQHPTTGTLFS
jgi:hypothetical protein